MCIRDSSSSARRAARAARVSSRVFFGRAFISVRHRSSQPRSSSSPDVYKRQAQSSGLADGLSLGGAATLTRGQAAILFYNLLFTEPKGSDQVYLTTLGGSLEDNVVVLSTDATADDGTTGSVLTTSGTYKTDRVSFPGELNGTRGQLVLDKNKKLLAVLPEEGSTFRSVTVMGSPEANAIPCLLYTSRCV